MCDPSCRWWEPLIWERKQQQEDHHDYHSARAWDERENVTSEPETDERNSTSSGTETTNKKANHAQFIMRCKRWVMHGSGVTVLWKLSDAEIWAYFATRKSLCLWKESLPIFFYSSLCHWSSQFGHRFPRYSSADWFCNEESDLNTASLLFDSFPETDRRLAHDFWLESHGREGHRMRGVALHSWPVPAKESYQ